MFERPLRKLTEQEAEDMNLQYYDSSVHVASFELPRFARKVIVQVYNYVTMLIEMLPFYRHWESDTSADIINLGVNRTFLYLICFPHAIMFSIFIDKKYHLYTSIHSMQ